MLRNKIIYKRHIMFSVSLLALGLFILGDAIMINVAYAMMEPTYNLETHMDSLYFDKVSCAELYKKQAL